MLVFSVYDVKAELFGVPFFMRTRGEALRAFQDLANNDETTVGRHPSDFRLVFFGQFDDKEGKFSFGVTPEYLGFAADYRALKAVPIGVSEKSSKKVV